MDTIESLLHDVPLFAGPDAGRARAGRRLRLERALPRRRAASSATATRPTRSTSCATAASRSRRSCPPAAPSRSRRSRPARSSAGRGSSRRTAGTSTRAPSRSSARRASTAPACAEVRGRPAARLRPDVALRAGRRSSGSSGRGSGSWTSMATPALTEPASAAGRWRRCRSASTRRRRELRDTWTLELEPVAGERLGAPRRASSRCSTPSGSARCRSRSRGDADGPLVHTVRAVGAGHAGDLRVAAGRGARRARAVRERLAASARPPASDVVVVAGGIGLAPLRPARLRGSRAAWRVRRGRRSSTAAARPPTCSTARSSSACAAGSTSRSTSPSTRAEGGWRGQGRRRAEADRRRALRPGRRRSRSSAGRRS